MLFNIEVELFGGVVLPNIFLTIEVGAREYCFFKEAATTIFIEDEALPNKP